MAAIPTQQAVAEYHREMAQMGHDMYIMHRDWHIQNRDPVPPQQPDRKWGTNLVYGTNFLQMHHEMVKAADDEPKLHMVHQSIVSWYRSKGYDLPPPWGDTVTPIPDRLAYDPDPTVYPDEIAQALAQWAASANKSPAEWLRRLTDDPQFALPKWFTREGIADGEDGEPYTGARKLADFQNTNQLGCCIVFPHNEWHGRIGGAMSTTWTAIADPIFYFGVHWAIDAIFDEYKLIHSERSIFRLDVESLRERNSLGSEELHVPEEFTPEQQSRRVRDIEISRMVNPARR